MAKKSSTKAKQTAEHKWAAVFIEIALRAVRRVHYEYGLWGIGPQWEMNRPRASRINGGKGIELADETAVCAAITQEFVGSPALAGLWVDDEDKKQLRYFMVDRETPYKTKKSDESKKSQCVDLFVQKFVPEGNVIGGDLKLDGTPSFIEARSPLGSRHYDRRSETPQSPTRCRSD